MWTLNLLLIPSRLSLRPSKLLGTSSAMAKTEITGKKVSSAAAKVLRSKTASKAVKETAASALTQKGENDRILRKAAHRFDDAMKSLAKR